MIDTDLYEAKKLYPFQEKTVETVLEEFRSNGKKFNLLYQLPTGGGKTVIFSAIAKKRAKFHIKGTLSESSVCKIPLIQAPYQKIALFCIYFW